MANIGSRVFEKSPSETVWKIGIAPSLWFHGGPKGRKKPYFAVSSYLYTRLRNLLAIYQTVSLGSRRPELSAAGE
jgi:hypothetical protein